jgi:hypothetical protein
MLVVDMPDGTQAQFRVSNPANFNMEFKDAEYADYVGDGMGAWKVPAPISWAVFGFKVELGPEAQLTRAIFDEQGKPIQ